LPDRTSVNGGDDYIGRPGIGDVMLSARVGARHYFAAEHLWAARLMATRCRERENRRVAEGFTGIDYEVRSYALTAITESVAFLEARVDEVLLDAADSQTGAVPSRLEGLDAKTVDALRVDMGDPKLEKRPTLEKYDHVLSRASVAPQKGRIPHQDVGAIADLRNAFSHFQPELQWEDEVHSLEKRLKVPRVPTNPLLPGPQSTWFPHQPLCAGFAEWAWRSCVQLVDEWEHALGLRYSYRDALPVPWPDEDEAPD
jgi:hypothetical protein